MHVLNNPSLEDQDMVVQSSKSFQTMLYKDGDPEADRPCMVISKLHTYAYGGVRRSGEQR